MLPFRIDDIRNLRPCYDPSRYLAEDWTGTALDVLALAACPAADRIWVVLGMMSENDRRLAACCFVRRTPIDGRTVWDLLTDDRSRKAVEVAERFADGEATERELDAASAAARGAANAAAWDEASAAAWDAANAAAWDAASAAASAAARGAARAAAWDAASAAANAAAWAAARGAAWDAANAAAWAAARGAQIDILREILTA